MRISVLLFSLILAPATLFAQLPDETLPDRRQPTNTPGQVANLLEGFAESSWGENYANMREKFLSLSTNPQSDEKVEIVFEDKEKTLLIRRNGIFYSYRFYSTPKIVTDSRPKNQRPTPTAENKSELEDENHSAPGILFSVGVLFRYLPGKDVQQKLEQKYGKPKKESLAENKIGGAILWEKTDEKQSPPKGGYVVQWKEAYKKMPFTRRVDYFSSSIRFQIEKEYKEFFSAEEIKTLRDLIP
ncbi:hypothetical protein [Leptospira borgpetersenii]|uniref:hypothetical protein n=1 Tax=Leptospira borgpetersenii TaxID=174 RepID=UPI0007731AAB|nr:hypothetical protein [Leptospira borgpetersenii]MBE8400266.1 hypothetical protein [Leptospira borgpetersenii serovar Tarassovi]MBE8404202.1 hypothetical protein [Leptospira borgpetersenii serovar Tarassovi]MBE8405785.1 hypothetical protein [Leptospira borgpetersenii serovar Tarassovi]MBE8413597.1 hypothetical protein [Leptospira borgpetersenii serovar Tarassovi]MBE8414633.1 hypothetical protein [Leptospira borgpetersenii serovar Tarassovi]